VEDLLAVMDSLEVGRATLVGCSAGGLITICFALEHPERVSALVLVGPIVSGLSFSEHFRRRGDRGMPAEDAPLAEQIAYWAGKDPWIVAPENTAAKARLRSLLTANPQNLRGAGNFARWPGYRALGRLSEIKVPTLLVAGESDIPDVHAHIGAIEAGVGGSRRLVLKHSGHLPHFEVPDAFNAAMRDFLEAGR
jgi:pimeloyl-ACP methyl ester carboxylesterase